MWLRGNGVSEKVDDARGLAPPLFAIVFLPRGIALGFVVVTLSYALAHSGVSVADIAGLAALALLPTTLKFIISPIIDMTLTSKRWYLMAVTALTVCLAGFALTPLTAASLPLLRLLCLLTGALMSIVFIAAMAVMAHATPAAGRGAAGGWTQVALMGGHGLGGGLGLWIATHASGPKVAALVLAGCCLVCVLPVLLTRIPRLTTAERLTARMALIAADVWRFVRTRDGALAIAVLLSPAAIGGATGLLAASSHAWQASSDLVALVCGALSGLAAAPGCVAGGYLSNRFSARTVYVVGALIFAAGEAAMAVSPHTRATFAGFVLLNAFLLGVANGAYLALIYGCLSNRSVATLGSLLASLGQVPVTLVTLIVGRVATAHGANAMLLVEAGPGAASMAVFALLVWLWRPAPRLDLAAAIT